MPKVSDAARVTTRSGAIWRECTGCGVLAATTPADPACPACTSDAPLRAMCGRWLVCSRRPAINDVRNVHLSQAPDLARIAALAEIAGAAATLARSIAKRHHIDPDAVVPQVRDAVDVYAVLGRGRWLPTMTRHVPAPDPARSMGAVLPLVAPPYPQDRTPRPCRCRCPASSRCSTRTAVIRHAADQRGARRPDPDLGVQRPGSGGPPVVGSAGDVVGGQDPGEAAGVPGPVLVGDRTPVRRPLRVGPLRHGRPRRCPRDRGRRGWSPGGGGTARRSGGSPRCRM